MACCWVVKQLPKHCLVRLLGVLQQHRGLVTIVRKPLPTAACAVVGQVHAKEAEGVAAVVAAVREVDAPCEAGPQTKVDNRLPVVDSLPINRSMRRGVVVVRC